MWYGCQCTHYSSIEKDRNSIWHYFKKTQALMLNNLITYHIILLINFSTAARLGNDT